MKRKTKQSGFAAKAVKKLRRPGLTLTELLITIVIIVMLAAFSIPAIDAFVNSLGSTGSAAALINAALSSARAMAVKEQRYVGIRFQFYYNPNQTSFLADRDMYMIFIEQNPRLGAYFFTAVDGIKPVKLPPNIGVTDLTIVLDRSDVFPNETEQIELIKKTAAEAEVYFLNPDPRIVQKNLQDISTFSIVFSPAGNLAVHRVMVRNKDGFKPGDSRGISSDEVFNIYDIVLNNVSLGIATFMQDDYPDNGLGPEPSRRYFLIFERDKFTQGIVKGSLYSSYLQPLIITKGLTLVNPYTGTLIQSE